MVGSVIADGAYNGEPAATSARQRNSLPHVIIPPCVSSAEHG
jgi:hypothetical protein